MELVYCSVGASEAQAIELEDPFKVREQHFDLVPLALAKLIPALGTRPIADQSA